MASTSYTKTFDALVTTTMEKYSKKLRDNFFTKIPFFDFLRKKGQMQTVDGGERIIEHLLYAANSTARSFSGYTNIDLTPQEGITAAFFTPREYDVSVVISRREKQQNAGAAKIIDLVQAKTLQAERSLFDLMSQHAFAAQSGTNLDGLQTLVSNAANTCGGINESTEAWWGPNRNTTAYTASAPAFKDGLINTFNTCQLEKGDPDIIVTTQSIWEGYHAQVEDQGRFRLDKDNAALGFGIKALGFMGVPLVWDGDCGANRVYILDSDTIKLQVYKGADFDVSAFQSPIDQHAFAKSFYWMGNMTINNRRANGIMTNVT